MAVLWARTNQSSTPFLGHGNNFGRKNAFVLLLLSSYVSIEARTPPRLKRKGRRKRGSRGEGEGGRGKGGRGAGWSDKGGERPFPFFQWLLLILQPCSSHANSAPCTSYVEKIHGGLKKCLVDPNFLWWLQSVIFMSEIIDLEWWMWYIDFINDFWF